MTRLFDSLVLGTIVSSVAIIAGVALVVCAVVVRRRGDHLGAAALCMAAATCTWVGAVFAFAYARRQGTADAVLVTFGIVVVTGVFALVLMGVYLRVRFGADSDEQVVE